MPRHAMKTKGGAAGGKNKKKKPIKKMKMGGSKIS